MVNYSKELILNVTSTEKDLLIKLIEDLTVALSEATVIKNGNFELSAETRSIPTHINGWKTEHTGWKTLKLEVKYKEG